jgi:hypothetical protein
VANLSRVRLTKNTPNYFSMELSHIDTLAIQLMRKPYCGLN